MECGTKLERKCANCQTIYPEGAKFCMECGFSLQSAVSSQQSAVGGKRETESIINPDAPSKHKTSPPLAGAGGWNADNSQKAPTKKAAERRQLTCLFCDLVGSTALSEQLDAEDFRQVILDYQQIAEGVINQHGGHIAQYLGDGLLVYFGYPKGLENAPKAGVQAGLGILEAVAKANGTVDELMVGDTLKVSPTINSSPTFAVPINIRIGIHSGLVVVDDHLALGDTVNIAARLEGLAPVNGMVISPQTLKLVQGWFAVKSLGKEVLKGIKAPMEIFQVLKESGASSRIEIAMGRGLSPLVGREEEVYMLLRNWKKAKEGKGQLLLLNGEAGIGKSRLVESIKGQVKQEQKAAKLELRCSDYHVNSPFYPLIDLLEKRILQFEKDETAASKITKLETWMEFAGLDKKPNLPIYADFLSIPIGDELRTQYENTLLVPAGKRRKFVEGFSTALFHFAQQQPLLLIVEDLHWMDSATLEWLTQLVEQINAYPLLVLGTTRPQFQPPWANKSYIAQLNLSRLNTGRIESICYHQTQGKALPKEILQQIKAKTDGVPLFVEELTRMIIESDLLVEKEAHYELNPAYEKGFDLAVPSTLQDSLIARLDNLSGSRAIAQIGAVLGREFSFELLQAVIQKEEVALEKDLAQLVTAELLYKKGVGTQATYIFKHALIQDTAYGTLLRSRRQELHQRVVTVLKEQFPELVETQPELLAHHLTEAGIKEQALLMWEKAGNKSVEQNATLAAVYHFQKALALINMIDETANRKEKELSLLIAYNGVLMLTKGWGHPEVEKNGSRIIKLCKKQNNTALACIGYFGMAVTTYVRGQFDIALKYGNKGLAIAKKNIEPDFRPLVFSALGDLYIQLGDFHKSRKNCEIAIQIYKREQHQFLEHFGLGNVWFHANLFLFLGLHITGYLDQAEKILQDVRQQIGQHKNILTLYRLCTLESTKHFFEGNWDAAHKEVQTFLPIIEESGELAVLPQCQLLEAIYSLGNGSMDGFQKAKEIFKLLTSINFLFYQSMLLGMLAKACQKNAKIVEGLECVNKALSISQQTKETYYLSHIYYIQGNLLLMNHQPIEAEQSYHQAITIAQQQSAKWFELLAAKSLARLWQSQGKTAEAYELLHGVYSWFTEGFDTKDMVEAKGLLAELRTQKQSIR